MASIDERYRQRDEQKKSKGDKRNLEVYNYKIGLTNEIISLLALKLSCRLPESYQTFEIDDERKKIAWFLCRLKNSAYVFTDDGQVMRYTPPIRKKDVAADKYVIDKCGFFTEVPIVCAQESIPNFPDLDLISGIYSALSGANMLDNFGLPRDYDRWSLTLDQREARQREAAARSAPQPKTPLVSKVKSGAKKGFRNFMNYE